MRPLVLAAAALLTACSSWPAQPPARPSTAATNRGEGEACGGYPIPDQEMTTCAPGLVCDYTGAPPDGDGRCKRTK